MQSKFRTSLFGAALGLSVLMGTTGSAWAQEQQNPLPTMPMGVTSVTVEGNFVRIVGVGMCHTDVLPRTPGFFAPPPIVVGHEGAGVIEAIGDAVTSLAVGDHVVLSFDSCGQCANCLAGQPAYCDQFMVRNLFGRELDGTATVTDASGEAIGARWFGQSSFASHAIATERNAVKVDPSDPRTVWVGTGETWVRNSVAPGEGVYKTTDAGETWTRVGLERTERIARIAIDPATRDTLAFLLRNLVDEPLLLAMTVRSDDLHRRHPLVPWLAETARTGRTRRLELERLDAAGTAAVVAGMRESDGAGPLRDLTAAQMASVHERSDGSSSYW